MELSARTPVRGLRFFPVLALLVALCPAPASAGFGDWLRDTGKAIADTGKAIVDTGKKKMDGGFFDKVVGAVQVGAGAVTNGTGNAMAWLGEKLGGKPPPAPPAPRSTPTAQPQPPPRTVVPAAPTTRPPTTTVPPTTKPPTSKPPATTTKPPATTTPKAGSGGSGPVTPNRTGTPVFNPVAGGPGGSGDRAGLPDYDGRRAEGPDTPGSFDLARGPRGGFTAGDPAGAGPLRGPVRDAKIPDVGAGHEVCANDPACAERARYPSARFGSDAGAPQGGSASLGSLLGAGDVPSGFPGHAGGLGEPGALDGAAKGADPELSAEAMAAAMGGDGVRSRNPGGGGGGLSGDKIAMLRDQEGADSPAAKAAALLQSAEERLQARQWDEAIWALDQAIELTPNNPVLWVKRSTAKNMKGDYAGAESDAREAIRLNPDDAEAWVNLAWAQLRTGRYQDALDSATRAILLDPKNALAYSIRAYASEALGDHTGKMADIKMAARLDPRYQSQYERGLNGGAIYNPEADYAPFFLSRGERAPVGPGLGLMSVGLLLLVGASVAGARWFEIRTGRTVLPWWPKRGASPVTIQARKLPS